jgi:hypothetical protein
MAPLRLDVSSERNADLKKKKKLKLRLRLSRTSTNASENRQSPDTPTEWSLNQNS